jgi:hypothetical protein
MQNAKDTFYVTLQARLAALNPARTMVLRGVTRPGTLVEENELATGTVVPDVFRLEWTGLGVESAGALPLAAMECVIAYCTDGTAGNAGMDRGRLLAQMDAELETALRAEPRAVTKMNYSAAGVGVAPVAMATNIFWADPVFGAAAFADGRLTRTATVQVFAFQEAGEL